MPLDNLLFGTLVSIMFPRLSVISKGPVLLPACVNLIVITCDISFNYYRGGIVVVVVVVGQGGSVKANVDISLFPQSLTAYTNMVPVVPELVQEAVILVVV